MPETQVVFFCEKNGTVPLLDWMDKLQPKVQNKCYARIERLKELGHELRRPEADYLRNDIYELRPIYRRIQYRILYFFHEGCAILVYGLIKETEKFDRQIDEAIIIKNMFEANPQVHTYEEG